MAEIQVFMSKVINYDNILHSLKKLIKFNKLILVINIITLKNRN